MKKSKVISRVLGIIITTVNVSLISAQPFPNGGYQGVTHGNRIPVHTICIPEGWSGISSYINPLVAEVDQICVPIESELVIMYNQFGLYWPGVGLNSLVNWDTHSGYVIKVTNDCSIELRGYDETDQAVDLPEGWSLIPVLSR
nr:hypothetical protein [Bacteroidota bacterium]